MELFRVGNENVIFTVCEYQKLDYDNHRKHIHPFCELLYVKDGVLDYVIEDGEYRLKAGDVLIIDSAKYHYLKSIVAPPYKRICFQFMGGFLEDQSLLTKVFNKNPHYSLPKESPIPTLLNIIEAETENDDKALKSAKYKSVLTLILLSLLNLNNEELVAKQTLSKTCDKILSYVNEHLTTINGIEQIAEKFFFSKSYISHVFKDEMKVGIMHYIRDKKILLADSMLKAGKRPIDVAKECGYDNYISFYRLYTAHFKRSPSSVKSSKQKQ